MEKIIEILMERDSLSREEAASLIDEVKGMIDEALVTGNYTEVEEIVASELGLEMDYIMDLI